MNEITRNPLCWPNSVPRTAPHQRGSPHFNQRTLAVASGFVLAEINRLNRHEWDFRDERVIISTNLRLKQDGLPAGNQPQPSDSGVAVYFQLRFVRNGKWHEMPIVLACDKWRLVEDNLYAIGKDIEAQRARERWGCTRYEQSFRGYLAIAEKCGGRAWWDLLGVPSTANKDEIKNRYRELAMTHHPDKGGNPERWVELSEAYEQAMAA